MFGLLRKAATTAFRDAASDVAVIGVVAGVYAIGEGISKKMDINLFSDATSRNSEKAVKATNEEVSGESYSNTNRPG